MKLNYVDQKHVFNYGATVPRGTFSSPLLQTRLSLEGKLKVKVYASRSLYSFLLKFCPY